MDITQINKNKGFTSSTHAAEQEWLKELRDKGYRTYVNSPSPTSKDENWRFASIFSTDIESYKSKSEENIVISTEDITRIKEESNFINEPAAQLVFADDKQISQKILPKEFINKGVIYLSISEALEKCPELLKSYFLKRSTKLGSEKYFGLHASLVKSGSLIYVPSNVEIENPIVNYYWLNNKDCTQFPHTLVIAEPNSKVSVIDVYKSSNKVNEGLNISVCNLYAKEGSKINRNVIQDFNLNVNSFQLDLVVADHNAEVKNIAVNLGSKKARYENEIEINGSGTKVNTDSVSIAESSQELDQRTFQTHNSPNSISDLLYKNALFQSGRTIFSGLIKVAEGAQQTDAYQTNRNLLLDKNADANALPGLEILANDVKCSHGATTGNIDEEELFYMLSRGIPKNIAMQLIVLGFFEDIIKKIQFDELKIKIRSLLENKFKNKI